MTELPIQGILLRVLSRIEAAKAPYMIMGGFAVRAIGIPRPTYDADLTLDVSDEVLGDLFRAFAQDGFTVPDEHRTGFKDTILGMPKVKVQRFEDRHVWDVDLFLVGTPYQRAAFDRRQQVRFLGMDRWMITPEDLILHKVLANRRKDLLDVEEILKVHRSVDRGYLKGWAGRLGVSDRLAELLKEAGLG